MVLCVMNVSEGRDLSVIAALGAAAGAALLDTHTDPHHHRSVLTIAGEEAARAVATTAVALIDLRHHHGVHPRLGVVDVVPFVALTPSDTAEATRVRHEFAAWFARTEQIPCFLYGPERSLPEVRRGAFETIAPEFGPGHPHPRAGATAVGVRGPLVAYNVWINRDVATATAVAKMIRGPGIRALGLAVGAGVQVSMNLIDPSAIGPAEAYDLVVERAAQAGATVVGAELVGLLPRSVLMSVPTARWAELDLSDERTIEARWATRPG